MEFKPTFTAEEVEEVVDWFNSHTYDQEIDLGDGIRFTNISKALPQLIYTARNRRENRNFSGPVYMLFRLRDALIGQGKVKD